MSSYTVINAKTLATIAGTSNSKEQKWVLAAHVESLQKNPFTRFISGFKGGKPIAEVMDTRKLAGDTITLHRLAPLAGPGRQGESSRDGQEEAYRFSNYNFTIGRLWNGTGQNTVARDQTVIGSNFDRNAHTMLSDWMGWKKGQDIEVTMIQAAHSRNTVRPNYKASREALRTADFLDGQTVVRAQNALISMQAKSLVVARSKAGAPIYRYLLVGNQYSLGQFKTSATYTQLVSQAHSRGDENPIFQGGLPDWNGCYMYEWGIEDHSGFGPIGAACVPRAVLGVAITDASTAQDIQGGGGAEGAALTTPLYFQHFSNSQYVGFEGEKRAASTGTTRYLLIQNISGADAGKFGFYSYTTNNGNKITMAGRLNSAIAGIANTTLGNVTWDTGVWSGKHTAAHPVGSLIYECNSYGVPFCYSYVLADDALISGYGSIDGQVAMGNRTEYKGPHNLDYAVGLEAVWGVKAIPRVDGLVNGFVLIESAWKPDGLPDIT